MGGQELDKFRRHFLPGSGRCLSSCRLGQASDGIFVSDPQGRYLSVNSAGAALLRYSPEEILGLTIADVVAPEEIRRIQDEVDRLFGGDVIRAER